MITARLTRLVRVPDLQAMHRAVDERTAAADPLRALSCAVLVPSSSAAESLRRTLEVLRLERGGAVVAVLPDIVTRAGWYARLHQHLPDAPPLLTEFERDVLFRRAARLASDQGARAPFDLRPGLVLEILAFYDELRRRHRTVDDFDRLITDTLEASVDVDRGAERLMRQTRFLTAAFREFERSVAAAGGIDEHRLRSLLIASAGPPAFRRVVVTVADQQADAAGLWTADFDLLARLPGLEAIDVLATENVLASGFHQRVHDLLPGIEETRHAAEPSTPKLVIPQAVPDAAPREWFTSRDREEELADAVRRVATGAAHGSVAVVFQRPLPYLYLARHVFAEARMAYEALDALPLAAEPFAAALDLVFTAVTAEATRSSLLELLRSPHWSAGTGSNGSHPADDSLAALDIYLQRSKYLGGWGRLAALAARPRALSLVEGSLRERAQPALDGAIALAEELRQLSQPMPASQLIEALLQFVQRRERLPDSDTAEYSAHMRARGAILQALDALAAAHRRHDDSPMEMAELAGTVRRWIEGQTFAPRIGSAGVLLLDARAAAYADLDDVRLVGLVESDWPERGGRSIFYPASLLSQLGWPHEADRLAAARARFRDLLRLARKRVSLSTFTLESDAIVSPSMLLEEVEDEGLTVEHEAERDAPGFFAHEALTAMPVRADLLDGDAAGWYALRASRSDPGSERFRGILGRHEVTAHAVSHLERYLECPFKYFAQHVLSLEEERGDESVLSPLERGQLLHEVFEQFFAAWRAEGGTSVTGENLPAALALFERIADARLDALSDVDRGLERTYLLGSAVAPGLAERALAFEIEHGVGVRERLLEHPLEGEFEFQTAEASRRLRIRGKADRIDLLEDGTLRIVDYKLGRAPRPTRALQLPVYGICACQHLEGRHGRTWTVSRAGYVAFREKNAFVPLGGSAPLSAALDQGQERLLATVAAVERGAFPVDPDEPFRCTWCGYATVCRKDYVGDE